MGNGPSSCVVFAYGNAELGQLAGLLAQQETPTRSLRGRSRRFVDCDGVVTVCSPFPLAESSTAAQCLSAAASR